MHFGETRSHVTLDGTGKTGKTASMGGSAVRRFGGSGLWKGNPVILIPQCCSGLKSIEIFWGEDAKTIKNNLANLD